MHEPRGDRGASLVEYALVVALVAVVVLGAVRAVGRGSRDTFQRAGDEVAASADATPGGGGGGGPAPGPTSPPAGGGGSTGGTTSTTSSTTTTTTSTTTTAPAPQQAAAALSGGSTWRVGWSSWSGSATVTIAGPAGAPLAGAEVEVRIAGDGTQAQVVTVTTGADGRATVPVGPYPLWGWSTVDEVDITITAVDPGTGATWDGAGASTTLRAPS